MRAGLRGDQHRSWLAYGCKESERRHAERELCDRKLSKRSPDERSDFRIVVYPRISLRCRDYGCAKLILQGTVTNASYCSDDRRIIWRPSFIALRLLT